MMTIEWTFQLRFAVALALGFLVGLERESTKFEQQKMVFGGVRTHPIISMFGFGCAWLHQIGATLMLPAGMLALGILTGVAYLAKVRSERFGSTSEISALLTFVTGALALLVDIWMAMACGIFNAMLLSEKSRLETTVEKLSRVDFLAVLKFLLITVIILPVLPDQDYTSFRLNPAAIWKIVILVSTVGFVGYVLAKRYGRTVGLWLSGLLGGIVSSTALTIAMGRIGKQEPALGKEALRASLLASAVMYLRVLMLIGILNPVFLPAVGWKFAVLALVGAMLALTVRVHRDGRRDDSAPLLENPFEITPALMFGLLFVLLTLLTGIVRRILGDQGLLVLGSLVGVTDIDPFLLSLVQGANDQIPLLVQAMILATMSNTLAKGLYFGFLVKEERVHTALRFGLWAALHLPVLLFS
jgi:uncharacterized membrane protein (DUF4010 family)